MPLLMCFCATFKQSTLLVSKLSDSCHSSRRQWDRPAGCDSTLLQGVCDPNWQGTKHQTYFLNLRRPEPARSALRRAELILMHLVEQPPEQEFNYHKWYHKRYHTSYITQQFRAARSFGSHAYQSAHRLPNIIGLCQIVLMHRVHMQRHSHLHVCACKAKLRQLRVRFLVRLPMNVNGHSRSCRGVCFKQLVLLSYHAWMSFCRNQSNVTLF